MTLPVTARRDYPATMAEKHRKRPRDPNQLAKMVVDLATGETQEPRTAADSPATEFARSGGLKGGKARAAKLSPTRRREIARLGAKERWTKKKR